MQLTGAGDSPPAVTDTAWVETATLTNPGNAALVGEVTTSGSAITGTDDEMRREGAGYITGTYTGDGTSSQTIDLGKTPGDVSVSWIYSTSVGNEVAQIWPGNTALPSKVTNSNIYILKDGFKVYDTDANTGLNVNSRVYTYIAHF